MCKQFLWPKSENSIENKNSSTNRAKSYPVLAQTIGRRYRVRYEKRGHCQEERSHLCGTDTVLKELFVSPIWWISLYCFCFLFYCALLSVRSLVSCRFTWPIGLSLYLTTTSWRCLPHSNLRLFLLFGRTFSSDSNLIDRETQEFWVEKTLPCFLLPHPLSSCTQLCFFFLNYDQPAQVVSTYKNEKGSILISCLLIDLFFFVYTWFLFRTYLQSWYDTISYTFFFFVKTISFILWAITVCMSWIYSTNPIHPPFIFFQYMQSVQITTHLCTYCTYIVHTFW